jgi:hypothetical protein
MNASSRTRGILLATASAEGHTSDRVGRGRRPGLIIIGTQLNGNPDYLGPAIVFSLVDLILVLFLSVEIGRHATPTRADDLDPNARPVASGLVQDESAPALPR